MKSIASLLSIIPGSVATFFSIILIAGSSPSVNAAEKNPVIDDFSDSALQTSGMPRMIIDDAQAGGTSKATTTFNEGAMTVDGNIVPGRGSPGFVSIPLILSPDGSALNVSQYTGVRVRVKLQRGSLIIQAASTDVINFDYHSSAPITRDPDAFQEVKIPFSTLKQVWSAPSTLNLKSITSINLVSAGMAPDTISYQIDEISFY